MINHLPDSPIDRSMDFPWGVPYGWYFVAYADELKPGDVKPLRYFEREQVLFRNEDGEIEFGSELEGEPPAPPMPPKPAGMSPWDNGEPEPEPN